MPVALLIGAVVGAGATVYAANKAAGATQSASQAATTVQEKALAQQKELSAPYTELGQSAMDKYKALLGLGPQGQAGVQQTLQNLPGYKFTQQQGTDATKAAFGAMGLGLSGNTLKGLADYTTGLADTTYGAEVARLLQPVQLGQAAAAGTAANIGTAAGNISSIIGNQGQTNAGIYANEAASLAEIAGNAGSQYAFLNTLKNLNPGGGGAPSYVGGVPGVPQAGLGGVNENFNYGVPGGRNGI